MYINSDEFSFGMIEFSTEQYMCMPKDLESRSKPLSISRPDKKTEEIIENAVRMAMEVGMAAAEAYLQKHNVNKWTALRVLSQDPTMRRKPR